MIRPEDYLTQAEMEAIGYVPQKRALKGKEEGGKRPARSSCGEPSAAPQNVVYVDFSKRRRLMTARQ